MELFHGTYHDYFFWLLDQVGYQNDINRFEENMGVLTILFETEFIWKLEDDANRAGDGHYYRKWFGEERIQNECPDLPYCTVLEMLVALSRRIWNEYIGDPNNPQYELVFFDLIYNLLESCSPDSDFGDVLGRWMERRFNYNGRGSIFPIIQWKGKRTCRELPIWEHMQLYINERWN